MPSLIDNPLVSSNQRLQNEVYLLGLDFGSTTSSALIASVQINKSVTGRMVFSEINIVFRSDPVFTPFVDGEIDLMSISKLIHDWLMQSKVSVQQLFSGGSIITGLAAKAENALGLQSLIKDIVGESVIAAVDDPSLESWLAFMGCSGSLSRYYSNERILNLDIGGGTTNAAIGLNGDVIATGCYFVGARHFKFIVGAYQLVEISSYGRALLNSLKITKKIGDFLNKNEREKILEYYIDALEAIALNHTAFFQSNVGQLHQQVALISNNLKSTKITFSGGVGELIYKLSSGLALPDTTFYGDFGIDLAEAIMESSVLSADLNTFIPENKGRATLYGLTLHNTEISGHTLFLPNPDLLPLNNLPIIAKLSLDTPCSQWQNAIQLACRHKQGACIQLINLSLPNLENIQQLAKKIQSHLTDLVNQKNQPFVILVEDNIGKVLGQYCSNWGQIMPQLIVIDEVPLRHAQFVRLGRLHQHILPVSFYGIQ